MTVGAFAVLHAQDSLEAAKRQELEMIRRQAQEKRAQAGADLGRDVARQRRFRY